jgi:hypothetical protein
MRLRILTLQILMTLCCLPLLANAATYNYYFSNAGGGSTCSQEFPCSSLVDARKKINDIGSEHTVNLYFKRGDSWSADTSAINREVCHGLIVDDSNDPAININAYGSGNDPIFDGMVSNFSSVPSHDDVNGPLFYNRFFEFKRDNCSISNVEIRRVYGHAVFLTGANYFTMRYCNVNNFGAGGISSNLSTGASNVTVEHNTFHTGQELWRYSKRSGWEAAIQLTSQNHLCEDNVIRYNLVYDIYGEGIQTPNSLCEYNVVGDTASIAINTSNHGWDAKTTIVRYNLVTMSDWSPSVYDNMHGGGSSPTGIRVFDEHVGGDNSEADIEIYGNVVVNRSMGIWAFSSIDKGNPYGSVKIYNNTVIDSHICNIYVGNGDEFSAMYIYNNSSILYNQTTSTHVFDQGDFLPHANWKISHNAFWTTGGSPKVDADWQTNYVNSDPKLPGEDVVGIVWDGQSGATYFSDIDFNSHLYPLSGSGLINTGKTLGAGYETNFLTYGTDFSKLPDMPTFKRASQSDVPNWSVGAIVYIGDTPYIGGTPISPPADLEIKLSQ